MTAPPNPSQTTCPECGGVIIPTELGNAEHKAKHLDWLIATKPKAAGWSTYRAAWGAWRDLARLWEEMYRDALGQLLDARDALEQAEADLQHERRSGGAA